MSGFSLDDSNPSMHPSQHARAIAAAVHAHRKRRVTVHLGDTLPFMPGGFQAESRPVTLSPASRLKHLYIVGATGSGKTNLDLLLIDSDIRNRRTTVVVDLRGDLVDRVLRRLAGTLPPAGIAARLVLLDLRDGRHVTPFNPLGGSGESFSRALYVLSVLRLEADSWGVQLEETLRNCLLALAEAEWTLLEVEPLLSNAAFRASVLESVTDPYVRGFFRRYGELSAEKQQGWRLPVLNKVTPLLSIPALRRLFGLRATLPLAEILNGPPGAILLIALGVDRLHEAAHLAGGLIVSAIQSAVMARVDTPEAARKPVMLYVDEFEQMATDRFAQIVAEGRRFGLGLTLSHQNLAQVPSSLREVIRNNVQTQVLFQTGALDAAELAREVISPHAAEEVRGALMRLQVGEAYVVPRGRESMRVKVPLTSDPPVAAARLAAARAAGYRRFAVPTESADAELAARLEYLEGLDGAISPDRNWEVRYGRGKPFEL